MFNWAKFIVFAISGTVKENMDHSWERVRLGI